ncbi:uncharacterized protein LOC6583310 [Drosophila mojavensis]|uniref:Uncharacterized protein, isoform A n=1 Tax=Drosophila mojavensis TaxID=7230 RepID=B4KVI5_DROMO|nr:uncharacterized protein LOC6583310 [Drosophila mojavensis]XP_043865332.1 uncharacterized protein LOC6583310 [Drosophila mojavensis]EDW19456.2 uncharacterized protein Dmoj_GI13790, isoform A [Drosophila mojavensis]KRG06643.1 uncharacterized protein Dmoj_GI13790, isoform B [Drosophila mojavensis]
MTRKPRKNSHNSARQKPNAKKVTEYQPVKSTSGQLTEDARRSQIRALVDASVQRGELASHNYYFIVVNCLSGNHMPLDLAAAQFSLINGLQNIHYTPVDQALDNDYLKGIHAELVEFLRLKCDPEDELPPVFTLQRKAGIASKALKLLNGGEASQITVLPIQFLCHALKQATCKAAKLPPPDFDNTHLQFNQSDHGWDRHNQINLSKQFCISYIKRWCFSFANYMCSDLGIKMIPNRHMPSDRNDSDVEGSPDRASSLDATKVNQEATVSYEEHINQNALDTLNSLDLDSIFENDDIWESTEEQNSSSIQVNDHSEKEDIILVEDENLEIVPPPPPILDQALIDDCAIFKRRPKKLQIESDNNEIKHQAEDNKSEKTECRTHTNTKQDYQCLNTNRISGLQEPVASEIGRDGLYRNKCRSPIRQMHQRPINCLGRWRSRSRSRSRSVSRNSQDHGRYSSSRKSRRSRSRSEEGNISPSRRLLIDRNVGRDRKISPIRWQKYHGSPSHSPRRLNCNMSGGYRKSDRKSREQREYSISPPLGATNKYCTTERHNSRCEDVSNDQNAIQLAPQCSRPAFSVSQYYPQHTINIQNFHIHSVLSTERPVSPQASKIRIPVLTAVPSQIPSHITYNNFGSHLSYNHEAYYEVQQSMEYQHSLLSYCELRSGMKTVEMKDLPENDLRHRLKMRNESWSQTDDYSGQQNLAQAYQMSTCPMPWNNGYGSNFPNNF